MTVNRIGALALLLAMIPAACDREPRNQPSPYIEQVLSQGPAPVLRLPSGDTLHLSPVVVAFYRLRGYRQLWTDYDELRPRGLKLMEAMQASARDGLDPEMYRYAAAERMVNQVEEDSLKESQEPGTMGEADLVLTEVFARYADHLTAGSVNPKAAGLDWRIPRDSVGVPQLLRALADGANADSILTRLRPAIPEYARLSSALERYRQIQARGGWPAVPADTKVRPGKASPGVAALRARLIAEGDPVEAPLARKGSASPDTFDPDLEKALEHFQARHAIDADGRLGKQTLVALNTPVDQRVLQIKLNMDRWRWLPHDLGHRYVLVNVAGFDMEVVDDDSTVMQQNVVVGKQGWETPIFRDTMTTIIINPTWNVPPSIVKEEVAPDAQQDPGYLAAHHFVVFHNDQPVDPGSVDWSAAAAGDPSWLVQQQPGPENALGRVKFVFPNKDDIYLHDTPADQLFSESDRAFSHGCIRVEHPVELAKLIMKMATDVPPERFDEIQATGKKTELSLKRPLPIYILYFTAWARDGSVRFYQDVYGQDQQLRKQAREKLAVAGE